MALEAATAPGVVAAATWAAKRLGRAVEADARSALFVDPKQGEAFLTRGVDFSNMEALQTFLVGNARRLGTAGKILFPIPNRRLSKRLYRLTTDTLLVWGRDDAFIPPPYAERWQQLLPAARLAWIDAAGHMAPYEQTQSVHEAIASFLE